MSSIEVVESVGGFPHVTDLVGPPAVEIPKPPRLPSGGVTEANLHKILAPDGYAARLSEWLYAVMADEPTPTLLGSPLPRSYLLPEALRALLWCVGELARPWDTSSMSPDAVVYPVAVAGTPEQGARWLMDQAGDNAGPLWVWVTRQRYSRHLEVTRAPMSERKQARSQVSAAAPAAVAYVGLAIDELQALGLE